LGGIGGHLTTCLGSSAQANWRAVKPISIVGTVCLLVGSWWAVPPILEEIVKEGSTHFERKSVPQKE
jgi:hypothetical protein